METDKLRLFNKGLVEPLTRMNDDELWEFVQSKAEFAQQQGMMKIATAVFHAYYISKERFREFFLEEIEDYREGVVFTLIIDFCFEGEEINLDYWARCGHLDSADSCDVITSDLVLPPIDEDSDLIYDSKYFHLLEPHHVENIIQAMENNFDKLTVNTRKDIAKIKKMKKFCLKNENYKVAYIYDM